MENRFCGLQMVQFAFAKVIHPLVSFTFWVNCGVPFFPAHRKREILHLGFEKVESYSWKLVFVDCKRSNLNVPGRVLHPLVQS